MFKTSAVVFFSIISTHFLTGAGPVVSIIIVIIIVITVIVIVTVIVVVINVIATGQRCVSLLDESYRLHSESALPNELSGFYLFGAPRE